jgi:hypothetical protein
VQSCVQETLAPQLKLIQEYQQACTNHSGTGYVINSEVRKNIYPNETVTPAQYCKKHGLDRSLWATFSKRYAQFVRVGINQEPPKIKNKLTIFGEYYYYADCAFKSVTDVD